jgi:acyl-CoA dehydrogenase
VWIAIDSQISHPHFHHAVGCSVCTVWDFETDPEYQEKLDWVEEFMVDELEPLDLVAHDPYDKKNAETMAILRPLQQQVKVRGLWAAHLTPELGGQGYGQVKLALLNEILGRSRWAPSVFGSQAPDSGNAEILALFGTAEQKARYLQPLLDGDITSCYSMTEPQGGSDPGLFVTRAERDGDAWVINGEKWFSTNARHATFYIVMAVTNPDARTRDKMSLFIVPAETPGVDIIRNVGVGTESHATHGYVGYTDVRVPADHILGGEGQAFAIAQTRLGGGRIHHAMRTIALARRAFDMMCERAVSRQTRMGPLSNFQMTQEKIADSWIQIEQFRLLVLRTAWLIDKHHDYQKVRRDIAAVKVAMPQVLHDVVQRALHLHGALGVSNEMPFIKMMIAAESLGIADGATELHKMTVARRTLREYQPVSTPFPSQHLPTRRAEAQARLAERLEHAVAEF